MLPLVDRGYVFAIAHIRGGQEMGRAWYDQGKMLKKKNTFTDFIAAAEYLEREGWTAPDRLAIRGGSAGGLLMGAVTNMRPDLFRVVVADVPFVDVINTMRDPTLEFTTQEWQQWGNPSIPEQFTLHALVLAVRQRRAQGVPRDAGDRRAQRPAGSTTGSPPSGWPGSARRRPTPTRWSSGSTWAPGTAAPRGATTRCGRRRSGTPSWWTRSAPEKGNGGAAVALRRPGARLGGLDLAVLGRGVGVQRTQQPMNDRRDIVDGLIEDGLVGRGGFAEALTLRTN